MSIRSTRDLEAAVHAAGLNALSPATLLQFNAYLELLLKWNSRLNLTAIREPEAILRRHFVECIQCAQSLPAMASAGIASLLDFGSGAGLPGIPIAICNPEMRIVLAESQRKKAAFLSEAVRCLDLNAEVFDGRVEDMPEDWRFSFVTLRAVDRMMEACQAAFLRVASDGWMVLFATRETKRELKQLLPGVNWQQDLPVFGLEQGEILFGQRQRE